MDHTTTTDAATYAATTTPGDTTVTANTNNNNNNINNNDALLTEQNVLEQLENAYKKTIRRTEEVRTISTLWIETEPPLHNNNDNHDDGNNNNNDNPITTLKLDWNHHDKKTNNRFSSRFSFTPSVKEDPPIEFETIWTTLKHVESFVLDGFPHCNFIAATEAQASRDYERNNQTSIATTTTAAAAATTTSKTQIRSVPAATKQIQHAQQHRFSISNWSNTLKVFQLLHCDHISTLPGLDIGRLLNLTKLEISNCSVFKELPPEIGNLKCLQQLTLDRLNGLRSLPPEIGNLTIPTTTTTTATATSSTSSICSSRVLVQSPQLQEIRVSHCKCLTQQVMYVWFLHHVCAKSFETLQYCMEPSKTLKGPFRNENVTILISQTISTTTATNNNNNNDDLPSPSSSLSSSPALWSKLLEQVWKRFKMMEIERQRWEPEVDKIIMSQSSSQQKESNRAANAIYALLQGPTMMNHLTG